MGDINGVVSPRRCIEAELQSICQRNQGGEGDYSTGVADAIAQKGRSFVDGTLITCIKYCSIDLNGKQPADCQQSRLSGGSNRRVVRFPTVYFSDRNCARNAGIRAKRYP